MVNSQNAKRADMVRYELLEWRDKRYRHRRYVMLHPWQVERELARLNRGYTGPRFIMREA